MVEIYNVKLKTSFKIIDNSSESRVIPAGTVFSDQFKKLPKWLQVEVIAKSPSLEIQKSATNAKSVIRKPASVEEDDDTQ